MIARIKFDVINLPVRRELHCGPFVLSPVEHIDEAIEALKGFDSEPVVTAVGTFPVGEVVSLDNVYAPFWAPAGALECLLSFAQRCHIQFIRPTVEVEVGGRWESGGWHSWMLRAGRATGVSWYVTVDELQGFLERSYPKVLDPEFGEAKGMRLAFAFYALTHGDDALEVCYLKTWIALEILYSRGTRGLILSRRAFDRITKRVKESLKACVDEGLLGDDDRAAIQRKLPELNRFSTADLVTRFLQDLFTDYPAQDVTEKEIQRFIQLRNEITHTGSVARLTEDYMGELHAERMRLKALLERVLLAMLGERPNLMQFSWRNWRYGR
jgi:hypothetical protein